MINLAAEGLILGLTMGTHCAVTCSPFIVPYLSTESTPHLSSKLKVFSQFIIGRFAAYLIFAGLATLIGKNLENYLSHEIEGMVFIAAATLLLVFLLLRIYRPKPHNCKHHNHSSKFRTSLPFLTGLILGVHICPTFLIALFKVVTIGDFFKASLYFISLFIGSTIYLLPVPFITDLVSTDLLKRLGIYLGFLIGIWFLIQGVLLL
jgi:sulfite exporter TauE/SafE